MSADPDQNPERIVAERLGEQGLTALVAAFYRRVRTDDVLGPLYPPEDFEGAEARLRAFLLFRFGVSDAYVRERGHPRLRMRHAPFAIGEREAQRWMELMLASMDEREVDPDVRPVLTAYFAHTAQFMRNRPG